MDHPTLCFLTDATLPAFLSDFRLPLCHLLLEAVSTVCPQRSHHGLTKHSLHVPQSQGVIHSYTCLGLGPVSPVACPTLKCSLQSFSCWLPGFFLWLSEEYPLPLPHLSVFSCSFTHEMNFWGFSTLLAHEGQPDACSLLVFAPYAEDEGFVYF